MENLKSNADIRAEASSWVAEINAILEADPSCKKSITSPFLEPFTHAVTIGELIAKNLRWRSLAPNKSPRLQCFQVVQKNNLLDWPQTDIAILRIRPENLFNPPPRAEMIETIQQFAENPVSVGDVMKIEGGWAVVVSGAGGIPESIPGYTIRHLTPDEITELPPSTQTGKKKVSVAALRIDAITAQVLKPSREQIKKHLTSGGVLLNYKPARKPGMELAVGDIVAVRSAGKYRLDEIIGETKKGRMRVEVEILNGG